MGHVFSRFIALCLLVLLSPFFLLLACVIILDSPGNPFFTQQRVGKDGKPFRIFKFRTMRGSDVEGEAYTPGHHTRNIHRITRIGRYMRKYGLDESLQLLNIIKGEMRFIGPRPCPVEQDAGKAYTPITKSVLPGLTGISQILPRKHHRHMQMITRAERTYEDHRTVVSDTWIWWRTAQALLRGDHE